MGTDSHRALNHAKAASGRGAEGGTTRSRGLVAPGSLKPKDKDMSTDLTPIETTYLRPQSIAEARQRFEIVHQFVRDVMHPGADFGVIPGANSKPTLLKPGAEKLCTLFALRVEDPELVERLEDWTGEAHGGEPFFYYLVRQRLTRNGEIIASQLGSCNSRESKYRYRNSDRVCPECGKPAIKKSKFPPRDNPGAAPGWYCHAKAGGCGANFDADEPSITTQVTGKVANPDVADQVNTILKMAQKRALVAAALVATNASELFTQDLEDMPGHEVEIEPIQQQPQERPRNAKASKPMDVSNLPPAKQKPIVHGQVKEIRKMLDFLGKEEAAAVQWATGNKSKLVTEELSEPEALRLIKVLQSAVAKKEREEQEQDAGPGETAETETIDV